MCDIWKVTSVEEITAADLQRHLQDIRALGVEWVVLSGGEPLMHSDLFRLTSLLRDSGIRTTILTTGLLLAGNAARIAQCVDDVIVSLDGPPEVHDRVRRVPGAFARLADGVRALRSEQAAYPVAARCTVQRENHRELRRTVAAALDLGLDSISFLAADLTSAAFNRQAGWTAEEQARVALSSEEIDALDVEIGNLLRDHRAGIERGYIREQEVKLRRLAHHFRAGLGQETPVAPRCNAPWVSAVVESDGSVRPCFFHAAFGNLRSGGLHEVLNAPAAVEFRKNLDVSRNPICGRCVCSLYRA
jgi:MoaA/NifB/PqqE/SkfB family radical SAM enzyme